MEVKILGTRAHIEEMQPHHQRHTGILIDKKILLDLGEKQFLEEKPKYIFITHLHPDHAYFEFSGSVFPSLRFKIFAPEKHPKVNSIRIVRPFETLSIPGYNITAIPVIHSLKVKSLAYLIETKKKRILFTGDVGWIEKHAREKLGKIDLVITEGSYMPTTSLLIFNPLAKILNRFTLPLWPFDGRIAQKYQSKAFIFFFQSKEFF